MINKNSPAKKLSSNLDMLGGYLSDHPLTIEAAQKYLHVGPQMVKDTLERLAERGIAKRDGSFKFVRGERWMDYAKFNSWIED